MQYIFRVRSDIPELGASVGDLIVLRPLDTGAVVTVMKALGRGAVASLLHNLDRLEPAGASPDDAPLPAPGAARAGRRS